MVIHTTHKIQVNTYYNAGSFISSLTVLDTNGCTDTYSVIITIEAPTVPIDSSYIVVPNVFTPNGDYENDFFKLNTNNIVDLEGTIFNRWGQVVFIINTVEGGWDGRTVAGVDVSRRCLLLSYSRYWRRWCSV